MKAIPEAQAGGRIEVREAVDGWRMTVKVDGERVKKRVYPTFEDATKAAGDLQYAPGVCPGAWVIDIHFVVPS